MNITTKFDLGQMVYYIEEVMQNRAINCVGCGGMGKILLPDNKFYLCPSCYGHGITEEKSVALLKICEPSRVVIIDIRNYLTTDRGEVNTVRYMINGSDSLWRDCDLFETKEEALLECRKRENKI